MLSNILGACAVDENGVSWRRVEVSCNALQWEHALGGLGDVGDVGVEGKRLVVLSPEVLLGG